MCAIFGVLDVQGKLTPGQRAALFQGLAYAAQTRGTDASGVAYVQNGTVQIQKAPRPACKMRWRINSQARYLMGHTRMTTQGAASRNYNNHPFPGRAGGLFFALAHNGVLYNDAALRRSYKLPSTHIQTDSYVAVQLLEKAGELSERTLAQVAEVLEGSYTFSVLDQRNTLYLIRGNNPLSIRWLPSLGCYLYASTDEILDSALDALEIAKLRQTGIPIRQGDIMTIDSTGKRTVTRFNDALIQPRYYCGWHWHGPEQVSEGDSYLEAVLDYGRRHGVPEKELRLLMDAGYDALDLEELIYDPPFRKSCIQEIMAGFGVC